MISATATRSTENFEKMKQIVNSIVERYGTFNISYSVIVFGRTPTVHWRLGGSFPDDRSLQNIINNAQKSSGASLDNALEEAKKVLEASPRKQAKKVCSASFFSFRYLHPLSCFFLIVHLLIHTLLGCSGNHGQRFD